MQFKLEKTLRDYIAAGNETTAQLLSSGSSLVAAIEQFEDFFRSFLWSADDIEMSPTQALLSSHAFMTYLSAARMALSGHPASTYPLFRASLEAACYAFIMSQDDTLERIWNDRHDSEEASKKCRQRFTPAVKETARVFDDAQPGRGFADQINEAYQASIDFGAHPNPRSIYHHVRLPEWTGDKQLVELIGLYGPDNFEVKRSLLACLDHGLILASILANVPKSSAPNLLAKLTELNDLKERVLGEHFPESADL